MGEKEGEPIAEMLLINCEFLCKDTGIKALYSNDIVGSFFSYLPKSFVVLLFPFLLNQMFILNKDSFSFLEGFCC